jgi:hypothetical protein
MTSPYTNYTSRWGRACADAPAQAHPPTHPPHPAAAPALCGRLAHQKDGGPRRIVNKGRALQQLPWSEGSDL